MTRKELIEAMLGDSHQMLKDLAMIGTFLASTATMGTKAAAPATKDAMVNNTEMATPAVAPEVSASADFSQAAQDYYYPSKLEEWCDQNGVNPQDLRRAPRELSAKLDRNKYSDCLQAFVTKSTWRHGQEYISKVPGPIICVPHNPHDNLTVYSSYNSAKESADYNIGAFGGNPDYGKGNGYGHGGIHTGNRDVDKVIDVVHGIGHIIRGVKGGR